MAGLRTDDVKSSRQADLLMELWNDMANRNLSVEHRLETTRLVAGAIRGAVRDR